LFTPVSDQLFIVFFSKNKSGPSQRKRGNKRLKTIRKKEKEERKKALFSFFLSFISLKINISKPTLLSDFAKKVGKENILRCTKESRRQQIKRQRPIRY